jgi:hypothetical protein
LKCPNFFFSHSCFFVIILHVTKPIATSLATLSYISNLSISKIFPHTLFDMANFQAITPPLGQQPWGPVQVFQYTPFSATPTFVAAHVGFGEFGYPPLDAPFRVLMLKKYPGTIFPDPDLEDGLFPAINCLRCTLG